MPKDKTGSTRRCPHGRIPHGSSGAVPQEPEPDVKPAFTAAFWAQILVLVLLVAAGAWFFAWRTRGRLDTEGLGKSFEYDLAKHSRTDPGLVIADEKGRIEVELQTLTGIAVDDDDGIYVAGDKRVLVLSAAGTQESAFDVDEPPRCIAVGPDGEIYVGFRRHVEVFDSEGNRTASWGDQGENAVLTSIVWDDDNVFVADAGNRLVWRFDPEGRLLGKIAEKDKTRGEPGLVIPSPYFDVAPGAAGSVWVVDPGRHELRSYSYAGDIRSSWKRAAMSVEGFCGCCNPTHIAMLPDGSFVTSEKGFVRVKIYGPSGDFIGVVAGPEKFAKDTRGLDLAVDSKGRILVLDPESKAVRIFLLREGE